MTLQESLSQLQKLSEENASLRKQIAAKDATILKQDLEIDRLRKIIFGKKVKAKNCNRKDGKYGLPGVIYEEVAGRW